MLLKKFEAWGGGAGAKRFLKCNIHVYDCFVTEITMLVYNNIVKPSLFFETLN